MFIRTEHLTVAYVGEERAVLQDVSVQIGADERVLLLGPSGAGKSTLLHALAGLVPRAIEARVTGKVYLDGRPVTEWTPAQVAARLGFVFQEPETQFCMLYPTDEVAFGLENLNVERAAMPALIEDSFARVDLPETARKTRIDRLSGGQQQRLALGAVLAQEPEMLLLDEPTALLDPQGRKLVVDTVYRLTAAGKGVIVVEHVLDPWLDLLERVIVIGDAGQIVADDAPRVVFGKYRSLLDSLGVWLPSAAVAGAVSAPGHRRSQPTEPSAEGRRADGPAAMSLRNVNASYGDGQPVLRDISLQVEAGEFWALIGPNGSGKSSLAKTLIRMLEPSSGEVHLQGQPVSRLRTRQLTSHIAYVFQNPEHQFVTDTVWGELNYSLRQAGVPDDERAQRVRAALARFGLEEHAASNPFGLSGGQKRRLAVAAMLQANAPLLVLDEPTFGQDRRSAGELMETIAALYADGVAVLMLTHDMNLVDEFADKVAVLQRGELVYAGSVSDLWRRPEELTAWGLELPTRLAPRRGADARGADGAGAGTDARRERDFLVDGVNAYVEQR